MGANKQDREAKRLYDKQRRSDPVIRAQVYAKNKAWRDRNKARMHELVTAWNKKNPTRKLLTNRRAQFVYILKKKFGITLEKYEEMLSEQQNKCAACGNELPEDTRHRHLDHCHTSKQIRGILCRGCNVALGCMKDSAKAIRRLADYVERAHHKR